MSTLKLETEGRRAAFAPGEELRGVALWELDREPKSVEVRCFWHTSGSCDEDVGEPRVVAFDAPGSIDRRTFAFLLPEGPYSLQGKLVHISWSLELVVNSGRVSERLDFVLSPTGEAVVLSEAPKEDA